MFGDKGNLTRSSLIILKRPGWIIFFEEISEDKISAISFYFDCFNLMSVIAYLKFKFNLNVFILSDPES